MTCLYANPKNGHFLVVETKCTAYKAQGMVKQEGDAAHMVEESNVESSVKEKVSHEHCSPAEMIICNASFHGHKLSDS